MTKTDLLSAFDSPRWTPPRHTWPVGITDDSVQVFLGRHTEHDYWLVYHVKWEGEWYVERSSDDEVWDDQGWCLVWLDPQFNHGPHCRAVTYRRGVPEWVARAARQKLESWNASGVLASIVQGNSGTPPSSWASTGPGTSGASSATTGKNGCWSGTESASGSGVAEPSAIT